MRLVSGVFLGESVGKSVDCSIWLRWSVEFFGFGVLEE